MLKLEPTLKADIHVLCDAVMQHCPNGYAKTYANAMLNGRVSAAAIQGGSEPAAYAMQINCILCNVANWRGHDARAIKTAFKKVLPLLK